MTNIQLYFKGLIGIADNFWPVFIYIIAALIFYGGLRKLKKREWKKLLKGLTLKEFIMTSLLGGTKTLI